MGKVDGRIALVTGAAQGMGAAHAELLAEEGAIVVACDISDEEGATIASQIGGRYEHLNVAEESDWTRVVKAIENSLGPISILINNAGLPSLNEVQKTPLEEWNQVIAVNLTGVFLGVRAVAASMQTAGGGVIVNVSSNAGLVGMPHIAAYAASKWGVRGLSKACALDLAAHKIRVMSLHPGIVRTPMGEGVDMDAIAKGQPISRVGEATELAKMMLFMVADATYSTGCEFIADGGQSCGVPLPI